MPPGARSRDLLLAASLNRDFSVSHFFKSTVKKITEPEKGGFERGEKPALEHIPSTGPVRKNPRGHKIGFPSSFGLIQMSWTVATKDRKGGAAIRRCKVPGLVAVAINLCAVETRVFKKGYGKCKTNKTSPHSNRPPAGIWRSLLK